MVEALGSGAARFVGVHRVEGGGNMVGDSRISVLLQSLTEWNPPNERAARSRAGMLELLQTSDGPFDRDYDVHHFTASGMVVSDRGFLLHKHKLSGDWLQPGGHIDSGEWPWEAAVRETLEETGVVANHPEGGPLLLGVDIHVTVKNHVHYDLEYLLTSSGEDPNPPAGESPEVGWFSSEEALRMTDDVCRNLIIAAGAYFVR